MKLKYTLSFDQHNRINEGLVSEAADETVRAVQAALKTKGGEYTAYSEHLVQIRMELMGFTERTPKLRSENFKPTMEFNKLDSSDLLLLQNSEFSQCLLPRGKLLVRL
jgi:hypothetical protein